MKTDIQLYVQEFLALLQEKIPTTNAKHRLELNDDGFLCLFLIFESEGIWQSVIFDDEVCQQTPQEVVDEILKVLNK